MIEALLRKCADIPHDKLLHFVYGVLIFAALSWLSMVMACATVVVMAIGKEVYDHINRDAHTPDAWDAVATIAGGVVGVFIKLV